MSLKTFQNPASKDSLFAYVDHDPLLKRLLTEQAAPEPRVKAAPVMRRMPSGRIVSESQYRAWRKRGGKWPGED